MVLQWRAKKLCIDGRHMVKVFFCFVLCSWNGNNIRLISRTSTRHVRFYPILHVNLTRPVERSHVEKSKFTKKIIFDRHFGDFLTSIGFDAKLWSKFVKLHSETNYFQKLSKFLKSIKLDFYFVVARHDRKKKESFDSTENASVNINLFK